jgi:N4-gp56 family major capsid protein
MADNPMLWTNNSGVLTNNNLNKWFQEQAQPIMRFRQFVEREKGFGAEQGQTVNWLRVDDVSNFGGKLSETSNMPETNQAMDWGSITVDEYGNSIPFTFKVEKLSEFKIQNIIKKGLLNDATKCMDGEVERQFNACMYRYVGTSTTANTITATGTTSAVNNSILNSFHLRKMRLELEKLNVPTWDGDYAMICSLEAMENLEEALEPVNQYTQEGYKKILAGEVGRMHGIRFIKDSFATRFVYDSTAKTATAKSWSNAQSLDAYMFGRDTVREAIVVPEEIRLKVTTDFGRSKGLAWYFLGGWKIDREKAADSRIIKWDSAS